MSACEGNHKVTQEDACDFEENDDEHCEKEAMTCDALCSLGSTTDHHLMKDAQHHPPCHSPCSEDDSSESPSTSNKAKRKLPLTGASKCCPKQLQLPMFLSSK